MKLLKQVLTNFSFDLLILSCSLNLIKIKLNLIKIKLKFVKDFPVNLNCHFADQLPWSLMSEIEIS